MFAAANRTTGVPIRRQTIKSPPVPAVSGKPARTVRRRVDYAVADSDTPPRFMMKSGSVVVRVHVTGFEYAAVWRKDRIAVSH